MKNMGTVFVDMDPFHFFRVNITRHIGALIDHKNLFPSVSRFSCEHGSVQAGTDDQIIVFHSFYMFPFPQTHLDTFLY